MKKTCLSMLAVLAASQFSYAQWTTSGSIMYNANTGNVGVGTTSPTQKLHVKAASSASALLVEGATGGYANIDIVGDRTTSNLGGFRARRTGDAASFFEINPQADRSAVFFNFGDGASNPASKVAFTGTGNIGIGTTTPTEKLSINFGSIKVTDDNPGNRLIWYRSDNTHPTGLASDGFSTLKFITNGVQSMTLTQAGNVGIGTTSPDQKLAVNGTIHSQRVLVDNIGWSDYVLYPDYKLPGLPEVKKYIEQNQHLPDIPSEKELNKTGVDVHEMLKLQMKKIEELTLYLIKEDSKAKQAAKKIAEQDARLKDQQAQLNEMKALLSKYITNPK